MKMNIHISSQQNTKISIQLIHIFKWVKGKKKVNNKIKECKNVKSNKTT